MCPRLSILKVPEIDMEPALFSQILNSLIDPSSITLTGWGEPLMHPEFFNFIDQIHTQHPHCDVNFTSNGHLLNAKNRENILSRRIKRLNISLEELPWEENSIPAEQARDAGLNPQKGLGNSIAKSGHPSSERVVDNLKALADARDKNGHSLELRLQIVMVPNGAETIERLIHFGADTGFDAINLVRLDVRQRPDLTRPDLAEERQLLQLAQRIAQKRGLRCETVNQHGPLMRLAAHFDQFCMRLDDYIYITVDGNVSACCLLRNKPVGDLREESLKSIWNKPEFKQFYGTTLPDECDGCDAFMNHHKSVAAQPYNV